MEIYGTRDLEKTDTGDEEEKYKDLKGKKTSKKEDLKKELDLVSVAKLPLLLAGQPLPTDWTKSREREQTADVVLFLTEDRLHWQS